MGRLKARLAASEADRELHTHLSQAERCLGKAAHSCGKVINTNRRRGTEARRAKLAQDTIRKALSMVSSIGNLTPRIDHSDRDMLSEEAKADLARADRQARDEAAAQAAESAQQGSN